MSPLVLSLILAAACIHATWNALLRKSGDRFLSMTVIDVTGTLVSLPFLFLLPLPDSASWFCIFLSAAIHLFYSLFLVSLYKHGELGHVYPIARGSSPLLVALGALVFAHEQLTTLTVTGILLVSGGIIALARNKHAPNPRLVLVALGTGCLIASYTVTDGIGARVSGNAISYAAWMFFLHGIMTGSVYLLRGKKKKIRLRDPHIQEAAIAGVLSLIGYAVIIWAISVNPMGPVSALRETSVVFAALIGRFFLQEKLTVRRMGACLVIAAGAACLG